MEELERIFAQFQKEVEKITNCLWQAIWNVDWQRVGIRALEEVVKVITEEIAKEAVKCYWYIDKRFC